MNFPMFATGLFLCHLLTTCLFASSVPSVLDDNPVVACDPYPAPVGDGTWIFIDSSGQRAIDDSYALARPFFDDWAIVSEASNHGEAVDHELFSIIDRDGNAAWGPEEANNVWAIVPGVYFIDSGGTDQLILEVASDGNHNILREGQISDARRFENLAEPERGGIDPAFIPSKMDGKWGFLDRKGEWAIPPSYGNVGYFQKDEGMAFVKVEGRGWTAVDRNNQQQFDQFFDGFSGANEGYAVVADEQGHEFLIDKKGNSVGDKTFHKLWLLSGQHTTGIEVGKQHWSIYDASLRELASGYDYLGQFSSGLAAFVNLEDRVAGYVDSDGSRIIEFKIDAAENPHLRPFIGDVAYVQMDVVKGRRGFINRDGDWILNP